MSVRRYRSELAAPHRSRPTLAAPVIRDALRYIADGHARPVEASRPAPVAFEDGARCGPPAVSTDPGPKPQRPLRASASWGESPACQLDAQIGPRPGWTRLGSRPERPVNNACMLPATGCAAGSIAAP
jgi:hypothetical protein